jgi:hypothetical protein
MWELSKIAFLDELEKIAATVQHSVSGGVSSVPSKPNEVRAPIIPTKLKAKAINPMTRKGVSTNYTRSNVESAGTDIGITAPQKSMPPPPVIY